MPSPPRPSTPLLSDQDNIEDYQTHSKRASLTSNGSSPLRQSSNYLSHSHPTRPSDSSQPHDDRSRLKVSTESLRHKGSQTPPPEYPESAGESSRSGRYGINGRGRSVSFIEREAERERLSPDQEMGVSEYGDEQVEEEDRETEELKQVWGPKGQWLLFIGIGLSAYIYSLDGLTTWQYLQYATSAVLEHSLSGTIGTVQAIIIAVGKPLMAKLADVVGRAETFIIVTILYVAGYSVIATADTIEQIAAGETLYAFGYTGLQMLQLIVIADMTNLPWRGLVTGMISAPFIINNFISAEIAQRVLPNWRLGYAMFAVLIPISLAPMIVALLWAQWKIRRTRRLRRSRSFTRRRNWAKVTYDAAAEMDFLGLLLIAAALALILLPLGLLKRASTQKYHVPSLFGMMIVGAILVPIFLVYEAKYPSKPVVPIQWLSRGPILGACIIGFLDFTSFYLQYTYLYPYVYVTREWSYRGLTYFAAIQSLVMTIFGIIGGALMWATHRFKYMLFLGLLIRLSGCLAMLRARSPTGTTVELILCQALQGIGGGFAAIAIQVSAQASVPHTDVATVTALVLLISEVGNSVGSASATAIWANILPGKLEAYLPDIEKEKAVELFGSMEKIVEYPMGDAIREGCILAYHNVMWHLVFWAAIIAIFPPIVCLFLTKDIHLGRAQTAQHSQNGLNGDGHDTKYSSLSQESVDEIENVVFVGHVPSSIGRKPRSRTTSRSFWQDEDNDSALEDGFEAEEFGNGDNGGRRGSVGSEESDCVRPQVGEHQGIGEVEGVDVFSGPSKTRTSIS